MYEIGLGFATGAVEPVRAKNYRPLESYKALITISVHRPSASLPVATYSQNPYRRFARMDADFSLCQLAYSNTVNYI
jgi:hypothetical protein